LKVSKDGKSENITIRVTADLKKRAEEIWKIMYSALPFNTFLGQMVDVGLKEEKMWLDIKEKRANSIKNDVLLRTMREGRENYETNGIPKERFEAEDEIRAERSSVLSSKVLEKAKKLALRGATRPPEAPQEVKTRESTDDGKGANPIHNKKRG
jgi:hypothetical protein